MIVAPQDMAFLAGLLAERSGQVLSPDKGYLVESRLAPVARKTGFGSVADLLQAIELRRDETLAWAVTEAMLITESAFFRDKTPFEQFAGELVPALAAARPGGAVRVWSAGCAAGQESYSLAMAAAEAGDRLAHVKLDLVATDLSVRSLEQAKAGVYSQFEVQRGLPARLLIRWFEKDEETWRVRPDLRARVRFGRLNLLDDFARLGRFDAVYCRNVLGGFDEETRVGVLDRLSAQLADDGVLVLGAAETLMGVSEAFRPVQGRRGLYVKTPARRAVAA